jgi:ubiquitin carboxyl-terminal hydrolase 22/27/51
MFMTNLTLQRFSHAKDKSSKLSTPVKFPLNLNMLPYTTLYVDSPEFMKHVEDCKKAAANGTHPTANGSSPKSPQNQPETNGAAGTDTPSKSNAPANHTYEELLKKPKEQWPINTLNYQLSAVIVHKGEINSGHYINYAREGTDWFLFDDSKVVLVSEAEVLKAEAYLMLYVLSDPSPWVISA